MKNVDFSKIRKMLKEEQEKRIDKFLSDEMKKDYTMQVAEIGSEFVLSCLKVFQKCGMTSDERINMALMSVGSAYGCCLVNFFPKKEDQLHAVEGFYEHLKRIIEDGSIYEITTIDEN